MVFNAVSITFNVEFCSREQLILSVSIDVILVSFLFCNTGCNDELFVVIGVIVYGKSIWERLFLSTCLALSAKVTLSDYGIIIVCNWIKLQKVAKVSIKTYNANLKIGFKCCPKSINFNLLPLKPCCKNTLLQILAFYWMWIVNWNIVTNTFSNFVDIWSGWSRI